VKEEKSGKKEASDRKVARRATHDKNEEEESIRIEEDGESEV